MNTLYLLGGPPRTAKTTIMMNLAAKMHVQFVAADAIEHGWRSLLTGKPHQMLRNIEISGSAEYKTSFTEGGKRKPFANKGTESKMTLQVVTGMLDYYQRNNESVASEGTAFTPEWVTNLKLESFTVRAAFVGYTDPSHADSIISHAQKNPHDWINTWLKNDEAGVRKWAANQVNKCIALKAEAERNDYPFFDISTMPFEGYIDSVQKYFLDP